MARLIKQSTMRMIMISTESDEMMPQLGVIPNVKPAVTQWSSEHGAELDTRAVNEVCG